MNTALATSDKKQDISATAILTGRQKAAIFMLALPENVVVKIFSELDELEVLELSQVMASLGKIPSEHVEKLFLEFVEKAGSPATVTGSLSSTEQLLLKIFPQEKVNQIMSELRGPAGKNMWEKLNNVDEKSLAQYLRNEHPQTIAVILSKIRPDHAAKIFSLFPDELSLDIMNRTIRMDSVQRDVLMNIEETLKSEFISNFAKAQKKDPHERMAEVFNFFDRATEGKFMEALERENAESAEKIRSLMFTFTDMVKLDAAGIQAVLKGADKSKLALALKGANEDIKKLFFDNMSERAGKLMREDMEGLGMVRLKEVDAAQMEIVAQTKELIDRGEVTIQLTGGEDEQLIG